MGRTLRDFLVPNASAESVRGRVLQWFAENRFRVLDERADGTIRTYDAPEIARGQRIEVRGGHLQFASPPGSVVALNVTAAGTHTPTAFAISVSEGPGGTRVHGEFFSPTSIEGFGGPIEFQLINTIWAPAGIQRKKAWILLTNFESFVASLSSPLRSS